MTVAEFLENSIEYDPGIVCTPPPPGLPFFFVLGVGGGLNLLPNFQKEGGGLDRTFTFREVVAGKEGELFSRGEGCNFYNKKINLNLKYLTTKSVYKQKYFSLS